MGEIILQNGKCFRPWAKSFSKMENVFVHGRSHSPKWKTFLSMGEVILQNGKRFRPWAKSFSKIESDFPQDWNDVVMLWMTFYSWEMMLQVCRKE